jgi:2-polyprenyl-3-methyl-5-hydroxy-6-metoxy-1,4-benzoquinol methylase
VKIGGQGKGIIGRIELLEKLVSGKDIIHLGCADHLAVIKAKIANNSWLHERLCRKARSCVGVDIDSAGVDYMKTELGYENVFCADLLKDDVSWIRERKWDYIVLGDILEHLDDPQIFLRTLKQKLSGNTGGMIITVPNAFALSNFCNILKRSECINTDHRYWFTPYTVAKVLTSAGYTVKSFSFCQYYDFPNASLKDKAKNFLFLDRFLLRMFPAFQNVLVMTASFN